LMLYPGEARLVLVDGGSGTTLDSDLAVDSDEDQWYEVYIKADGANIDVYRREKGDPSSGWTLILSTTSATETVSSYLRIEQAPSVDYEWDDITVLKDGGATYDTVTYAYNGANELTSMTQGATTTTFG